MNRILRNKVIVCVLVLTVISVGYIFADDVIVQMGDVTADGCLTGSDLYITDGENDYLYFDQDWLNLDNETSLYIDGNLEVNSDLGVDGTLFTEYIGDLGENPMMWLYRDPYNNDGYIEIGNENDLITLANWGRLEVGGYTELWDDVCIWGDLDAGLATFWDDTLIDGDLTVNGLIYGEFASSPSASCMYEQKSRDDIITYVKTEVPPDKQSGAAMFFNKDTKKVESYVASEGKFYDTEGNVIHQLDEVVEPTTKYETVYHFDKATGQIKSTQKAVEDEYRIKTGYSLDSKTGKFVNKENGNAVSREEALEIYAASEGKIYDLDHNFLRNADKKETAEIAAAGNFNDLTSRIKTAQNNTENQGAALKPAFLN